MYSGTGEPGCTIIGLRIKNKRHMTTSFLKRGDRGIFFGQGGGKRTHQQGRGVVDMYIHI